MGEDEEILRAASRRVGTTLNGKYRVDRVIGVGGMATVYAVTHRNRKRFAVKMLHPEFSVRRDIRARFIREGYVANSVPHPGVVAVLDDDTDETGAAFLVMELLEGSSVEALYTLERTPLEVREALAIGCQLLDVLDAAHEKSVIHRDIKPANLFLLNDGQLKVVDFGIARLREADPGLKSTRTGATLGTPAFMPPEQALAMPGDIDARTDVWAVGATLFTMLSARYVHEAENARQMMIRAATEPARSLASVAPHVPLPVVEIVTRALMFERDARWPSAATMRDALLGVHRELFGEPSRAELVELVRRSAASVASSPTEPSPATTGERASGSAAAEVPGALVASSRALMSTTSRPVSTGGDGEGGRLVTPTRLAAAVAAALAGTGIVFALRGSHPPTVTQGSRAEPNAGTLTLAPSPSSAPSNLVPAPADASPSAESSAASSASAEAPRPGSATPPSASATSAASATPVGGRPREATASTSPTARSHLRERAPNVRPSASVATGPGLATSPSNPLKLELQ
jgi:serine/threonine-protein kinase